jgi:hypothetical protein
MWSNPSFADKYEIVEFDSGAAGGTFDIVLAAPRWSICSKEGSQKRARVALAWTMQPSSAGMFTRQ